MKIYVKYENKHPYLPVAVGDSAKELAARLGIPVSTVLSSISHKVRTYAIVEVKED